MAEEPTHPIRLMNFVSEEQLQESKRVRGERVEDGTAQRDRPLFEILKENKDKHDAEFNERSSTDLKVEAPLVEDIKEKGPPKALDEDETEFLDKLEMSKREYERQMADEEAQELQSFQAAVAAQSMVIHELKEAPAPPMEHKPAGRKNPPAQLMNVLVKVMPQAKKPKVGSQNCEVASKTEKTPKVEGEKLAEEVKTVSNGTHEPPPNSALAGLVSYSDESDED